MKKIIKKVTSVFVAAVMATSTAVSANAYNVSWSLRQIPYAPTSEYCYNYERTLTSSSKSLSINCTSISTNNTNASVRAHISVNNITTYLSEEGDSCKSAALKTGIPVTNTVDLNVPDTRTNCQYGGNFKG